MKKLILIISVVFLCFNSMRASNPYEDLHVKLNGTSLHIYGNFDNSEYYLGSIAFYYQTYWSGGQLGLWEYCSEEDSQYTTTDFDVTVELLPYLSLAKSNDNCVFVFFDCIPLIGYPDDSGNYLYIKADSNNNITFSWGLEDWSYAFE